jgi:aryl-alcohol dehydrogenase-like predicted oxidoreductase
VIAGATNPRQIEQNAAAASTTLSLADRAALDSI